jgi:hypothetical protein
MDSVDELKLVSNISISVVVYRSNTEVLRKTFASLLEAVVVAQESGRLAEASLFIVDNDDGMNVFDVSLCSEIFGIDPKILEVEVIAGHGNVGYGRGHNLAINRSMMDYHLILIPDVILESDAILQALQFFQQHRLVGMISPASRTGRGTTEYLCKRCPSLLDLLLRGFAPGGVKRLFEARLSRYEFRKETDDGIPFVAPIVSGCFMFGKTFLFKKVGGFSNDYFMYFEDFDLSLRISRFEILMHVPSVRNTHFGGGASRKGWRHILMFGKSALVFYRHYGLKFF